MTTKDQYIDNLAVELHSWSHQLDMLATKTETSAGMARLKYVQELNALRANQRRATEKLKELETTSAEAWDAIKLTADKIWDDLRQGLASASSGFK